jgi:CheY-like chemotaxis protein
MAEGTNCLLVDDDADWIVLVRHAMKRSGLPVSITSFRDAKAALAQLRSGKVDLIITDLHMPGMDGLEFVRELRKRDWVTPTIVISSDDRYRRQALELGADAYLCKTSLNEGLMDAVKQYVGVPVVSAHPFSTSKPEH